MPVPSSGAGRAVRCENPAGEWGGGKFHYSGPTCAVAGSILKKRDFLRGTFSMMVPVVAWRSVCLRLPGPLVLEIIFFRVLPLGGPTLPNGRQTALEGPLTDNLQERSVM